MEPDAAPTLDRDARTTVVIATRDRRQELATTLAHLAALPERPPVIVVDNGSRDGSPQVAAGWSGTEVIELGRNLGAPARDVGVARASTPYVAFADDDSWWAPGALRAAADALDAHDRLALVAARMLVGPEERLDPVSVAMAASPIPAGAGIPGPGLVGFLACGAVVRRSAFLEVGGFDDLLFFLGEEALLAYDLLAAGWALTYLDHVVAHHHPSAVRDPAARRVRALRNDLLVDVLRRPLRVAARSWAQAVLQARGDVAARRALAEATVRLPQALARRRRPDPQVERLLTTVAAHTASTARGGASTIA